MLGTIMDSACKVWQYLCGGEPGSCWIYRKTDMGVRLFVWWIIVKLLSMLFNFLAQYFYKSKETEDSGDKEDQQKLQPEWNTEMELRETVI